MTGTLKFNSRRQIVGDLPEFSEREVKDEPMLFSCDLNSAWRYGGPVTRSFLDKLPDEFARDPTAYLDSRVHMLMPGWYPCIPGWHHDDVPRNTANGQPNYVDPPYRTQHVMALVNAAIAPTEFAIGDVNVPEAPVLQLDSIYKRWDDHITRAIEAVADDRRTFQVERAEDRKLILFDCDTFHRGTAAVANGWRWFGRVSIGRERKMAGEIRRQVQVYMPTINAGW